MLLQAAETVENFRGGFNLRAGQPLRHPSGEKGAARQFAGFPQLIGPPVGNLARLEFGDNLEMGFHILAHAPLLDLMEQNSSGEQRQHHQRQGCFQPAWK